MAHGWARSALIFFVGKQSDFAVCLELTAAAAFVWSVRVAVHYSVVCVWNMWA